MQKRIVCGEVSTVNLIEICYSIWNCYKDTYQDDETHQLNRFATNNVNGSYTEPITWDGTSQNNNQVSDRGSHENLVNS
jgi:hypothetical protein